MDMENRFTELIPGLPEEMALDCLARLHFSVHQVSSQVCKRWRELLRSKEFYYQRKKAGFTRRVACLIQAMPGETLLKSAGQPRYRVSVFDPLSRSWDWVEPVPKYPDGLPMFCQIASTEGKVIVMGGWDPSSWKPVTDVFMYDFTTREWTKCADMPSARSFFAVGAVEGKVVVAGGHDENKNALKSAWVFDVDENEWTELSKMNEERDECEGIVLGSEFWVVSGYETESQGSFKSSAEVYDLRSSRGEWKTVEGAWRSSQCPRSCVGRNGKAESGLIHWAESDTAVMVGSCGVDLGNCTLLTGSAYQGAPHVVFLLDNNKGNKSKKNTIVPDAGFSGFVQSGCCVEI